MDNLVGREFGQYRIVGPPMAGGMAVVYKAYQKSVDRHVALKVLPGEVTAGTDFLQRFEQEARIIARFNHANIVPVFDYGQQEGYTYIVMPFYETGTLADLLQGGPLPLVQIQKVMAQVGDALDYAHSFGIIHRDVKPSNVLIDERGNCMLTDFGIAKITDSPETLTQTGKLIGTPAYMSPEQCLGEVLDPRTDIYSLGVVLFEMATGRRPFTADKSMEIIIKHIQDPLPPPRNLNPSLPEGVAAVIVRSLEKKPQARYTSVKAFIEDLNRAVEAVRFPAPGEGSRPDAQPQTVKASGPAPHEVRAQAPARRPAASGAVRPSQSRPASVPPLVVPRAASQPAAATPPRTGPPSQPVAQTGEVKRKNWVRGLVIAVALVGLIGLGLGYAVWRFVISPRAAETPAAAGVMLGEFNIAQAEFLTHNLGGSITREDGQAVSEQIFQRVEGDLRELIAGTEMVYEVWGPAQVGIVAGNSPGERAGNAEKLASEHGIDLVIYGVIADDGVQQTILPEMYVSERLFSNLPEFVGQQSLGAPIVLASGGGDLASRVSANKTVAGRIEAIAGIAVGLSMYDLGDYQAALDLFTQAESAQGWEGDAGKEALYMMLGNTAGKLERVDEAEGYFQQALTLNPDYARGYIGMGEIHFRRALGIPTVKTFEEIDLVRLDQAEAAFRAALGAADQPASADIPLKVSSGLARLAFTRYQIFNDPTQLEAARSGFAEVIQAYEAGNSRISEIAALSHGHLGTIAYLNDDLDTARYEYQTAVDSTDYPRAKAAFLAQLGDVHLALGDRAAAVTAYETAVAIETDENRRSLYQAKLDEISE